MASGVFTQHDLFYDPMDVLEHLGCDNHGRCLSSFTTGRGQNHGHAPEDGAQMNSLGAPPSATLGGAADFGTLVLQDLTQNWLESQQDIDRLMTSLGHAMRARDAHVTRALWDKLCLDGYEVSNVSSDKWEIYGADAKWPASSVSLLRFLTLEVQRPLLVLAAVQVNSFGKATCTAVERREVAAILCAVLSSLYFVKRHGKSWEEDAIAQRERCDLRARQTAVEQRGAKADSPPPWDRVVDRLCFWLPKPPIASPLHCAYMRGGSAHYHHTSALQIAAICSETTTKPLESLLRWTDWNRVELVRALRAALHPGVLRGDTLMNVVLIIYWALLTHPGFDPNRPSWEQGDGMVEAAWNAVMQGASWYTETPVIGLKYDVVQIPHADVDDAQHPQLYEELMDKMASYHEGDVHGRTQQANRHRLRLALKVSLQYLLSEAAGSTSASHARKAKPHLVLKLFSMLHVCAQTREWLVDDESELLERVTAACPSILPDVVQLFRDEKPYNLGNHFNVCLRSLVRAIKHSNRRAFRMLMDVLEGDKESLTTRLAAWVRKEPRSKGLLDLFVTRLCDSHNLLVGTTNQRYLEQQMTSSHIFMIHDSMRNDLERFLKAGAWSDGQKKRALLAAGEIKSGIAVQVLIGPNWNVPWPDNNRFVRAIIDTVYAPEERIAQDAAGTWHPKREREEEGEGEEAQA